MKNNGKHPKAHGKLRSHSLENGKANRGNGNRSSAPLVTRREAARENLSVQSVAVICFSHLRWDFVYQRPQHLMSRFARERRVLFFEEPVFDSDAPRLDVSARESGVRVAVPRLPAGIAPDEANRALKELIDRLFAEQDIREYILWYYSPMFLGFTNHLEPVATVYDCMDELSAFKFAPPELKEREAALMKRADLVFTGGETLYEAKRNQHPRVYAFPSSVDVAHFAQAREQLEEPADQVNIPLPRLGFFGVVDERFDVELLRGVAQLRPDWQFVIVGPVVKIDPADLPRADNIHYLGGKNYKELPQYLAGWDVALLPFARNESTRFISPTKTPEYLAGGKPVVSTSIRDVVRPYGEKGLVKIADTPAAFVAVTEAVMKEHAKNPEWLHKVDEFLAQNSWDRTWAQMSHLIKEAIQNRRQSALVPTHTPVVTRPPASSALLTIIRPRHIKTFDFLIVGAGFAGSVLAERLASELDKKVLIIDKRNHIGGNAYDHFNDDGILVHKYGPHIFHTNSKEIFAYLSRFTEWRAYQHHVLAYVDGQLVPIPINLNTINQLYGLHLNSFELQKWFESMAEKKDAVRTSEDVVVSKVGRELYEKFFRNYTRKQWGLEPSELDAAVTARVPVRTNRDNRYFTDRYQAMPRHGYTRMFERLLDHPNIKLMLQTDYAELADMLSYRDLIYTGPIDEYFGYRFGKLPYRSLEFKHETIDRPIVQPVAVINYPNDYLYTRVTEFKHLTGQEHPKTSIVYEYPRAEGDPYYPVPRAENGEMYRKYKQLADKTPGVYFVGRLATYKYYNMDQVVGQALAVFDRIRTKEAAKTKRPVILPESLAKETLTEPLVLPAREEAEGVESRPLSSYHAPAAE